MASTIAFDGAPGILERGRLCLSHGTKPDADGETLGNVVHRDGDDEEEDPAPVIVCSATLGRGRNLPSRYALLGRIAALTAMAALAEDAATFAATVVGNVDGAAVAGQRGGRPITG